MHSPFTFYVKGDFIIFNDETGLEIGRLKDEILNEGIYEFSLPAFEQRNKVIFVTIIRNGEREVKRLIVNE